MPGDVTHAQRPESDSPEAADAHREASARVARTHGWGAPLPGLAAPVRRASEPDDPLGGTELPAEVSGLLAQRRGEGEPLPEQVRDRFGEAFGSDFSAVRVHTDAQADTITRSLAATAFTHGSDVYFSAGSYDPASPSGQSLLAHELTHVTQHQEGRHAGGGSGALTVGRADDPAEAEADATSSQIVARLRRRAATPGGAPPAPAADRPSAPDRGAPVRRDLVKDWKKDSKAPGARSRALKRVDTAVNTFGRHASEGAAALTLVADLKAVLQALAEWGKVDTSQRSTAAQALQAAVSSEIGRLTPKPRPKRPTKPKAPREKAKSPAPEPEPAVDPVVTPESVKAILEPAAGLVASGPGTEEPGTDASATPQVGDAQAPPQPPGKQEAEVVVAPPTVKDPGLKPAVTPKADQTPEVKPPETAEEKAGRYEAEVLAGKTETDLKVTRTELLDGLMPLTADRFAAVAATMMLNTKGGVVDEPTTRRMALEILTVQLYDKAVARKLLDEMVLVVVVPRNKKMTDLVEFSSLKDTKTFDGRTWNEVRGSGGFRVPGKQEVYVAVSEENTTGEDAEGDAAGTSWCYDKGYSTTSHEFAHVIDNYGLADEDRKLVDGLYKKKHDLEATTPQEWIDGWNVEVGPTTSEQAKDAWDKALPAGAEHAWYLWYVDVLTKGGTELKKVAGITTAKPKLITAKILSADGTKLLAADGSVLGTVSPDGDQMVTFQGGTPTKKTECYSSVHRLEYFAQTANAYLGTNAGPDPYTSSHWGALGQPAKGRRRNGKAEAKRVEPELYPLLEKLFGATGGVAGANPRKG